MVVNWTCVRRSSGTDNRTFSILEGTQKSISKDASNARKNLPHSHFGWKRILDLPGLDECVGNSLDLGTGAPRLSFCMGSDGSYGLRIRSAKANNTTQRVDDQKLCGDICIRDLPMAR